MVIRTAVALLALVMAGCGSTPPPSTVTTAPPATSPASTTPTTTTTVAEPTTVAAGSLPVILGIVSGRGDDLTLEVTVYFDRDPGDTPIVVGIDSDDSYGGSGDPTADLEGGVRWDTVLLVFAGGGPVVAGVASDVADWVSWTLEGSMLRVYFLQDVAAVTGTLWVHTGDAAGATAGVAVGEACSIRRSTLAVTPGDAVPDPGVACRYP